MLQSFLTVGQQILTLYLLLVVGFVLGKVKLLDDRASVALSSLVMYVVSPCMMVVAFQRPLEHTALHNFGVVTGVSAVLHVVFIAAAMLLRPRVLLADEPTGALDSGSTDELLRLFAAINRAGQTILMVTHSVKAASRAGRVLFIKDGQVFHQLYRGEDDDTRFYQRISDTLTMLQSGGEPA